jgi:hypothetical protein
MLRSLLLAISAMTVNTAYADEPPELARLRETCPVGPFPSSLREIAARPLVPSPSNAKRRSDTAPGGRQRSMS